MPQKNSAALIRTLSDLLQLDHDALRSYEVAIDALSDDKLKEQLRRFRRDHQRHVRELTTLLEANGAAPINLPHVSTGFVKLAVQFLGAAGGDRAVLLAFRSNEWEAAEKYAAAPRRRYPAEVQKVISRAAHDEQRHYAWAVDALAKMGAGDRTVVGRIEQVVERLHGGAALGMEALERWTVGAVSAAAGRGEPKRASGRKSAARKKSAARSSRSARA